MMTKMSAFLAFAVVGAFFLVSADAQAFSVIKPKPKHVVHHHKHHKVCHHKHVARPVVHVAPKVVHNAPVVVAPSRTWVPGHYKTVTDTKTIVPGHYTNQYVEPQYETVVNEDGSTSEVLVAEGHYKKVWIPAKTETVTRKVWVPGHYAS